MAKPSRSPSDVALDRVRDICLGFPGGEEKLSHGAPSFHVRGKHYLTFVDDHHNDGRLAVWCKASPEEQQRLVRLDPDRFYVPPYVGVKGWVGVRLDHPKIDWIELAILVEQGWAAIAPKGFVSGAVKPPPRKAVRPPVRATTDAARAREALERLTAACLALPEASVDRESRHASFTVRKKTFAYFLDNHHGDGIIGVCVKMPAGEGDSLAASDPKRFYRPAYMATRGWVGVRVDGARVSWPGVGDLVVQSYRLVAPKTLAARV